MKKFVVSLCSVENNKFDELVLCEKDTYEEAFEYKRIITDVFFKICKIVDSYKKVFPEKPINETNKLLFYAFVKTKSKYIFNWIKIIQFDSIEDINSFTEDNIYQSFNLTEIEV